jgi:hypothetical protein
MQLAFLPTMTPPPTQRPPNSVGKNKDSLVSDASHYFIVGLMDCPKLRNIPVSLATTRVKGIVLPPPFKIASAASTRSISDDQANSAERQPRSEGSPLKS